MVAKLAKKGPAVIIVGGGLAGLCCAVTLHEADVPVLILEASDRIGGRVASDRYDNFILDRGFQILLSAYPEAQKYLDYTKLNLHKFYTGAMVYYGGKLHKVSDPFRHPIDAMSNLLSPIGSLSDKMQVASVRQQISSLSLSDIFSRPEKTTAEALKQYGFSPNLIDRFFRPFLGGIFLDRQLQTSSRMFEFLFQMFSKGDAVLPVRGMGAICEQLAQRLPEHAIRKKSHVKQLQQGFVILDDGDTQAAQAIVVATEGPEAARLLGQECTSPPGKSVVCVYYAAQKAPVSEPILILNGEQTGAINNVCVPSNVSRSYAPEGQHLISVSILGNRDDDDDHEIDEEVRKELTGWFGAQVHNWRFLKVYRIRYAQPDQSPPNLAIPQRPVKIKPGVFVCGDHRDNASINGAMASGRRTALAVLEELKAGV